jgi:smad nuclear-interacting protein 1
VLPYIMDLGSTNGTFLNNDRIEARRYYELQPRDVLKFGFSSREYVVLYEGFRDTEPEADDLGVEQPKPQPAAAEKKPDITKSDDH